MRRANINNKRGRERGSSLVMALILTTISLALSGAAMVTLTARSAYVRSSIDGTRALLLAESGLAIARSELLSNVDSGTDGIGDAGGSFAGGKYLTTSAKLDATHYKIISTGRFDLRRTSVESVVEILPASAGPFSYGFFGSQFVTFSGGAMSDAFNSSVAPYVALNTDANGTLYDFTGGDIGSNSTITMNGAKTVVHGNAAPGVASSVTTNGGSKVYGQTTPAKAPVLLANPDAGPILDPVTGKVKASAMDYSTFVKVGNITISASGDFSLTAHAVLTIPPGDWWINSMSLTGNSTLQISAGGAVRIYCAHAFDTSGGGLLNPSLLAKNLQIYGLGDASVNSGDIIKMSGGSNMYAGVYAPKMPFTVTGGGDLWGAVTAASITNTGGSRLHHDIDIKGVGNTNTKSTLKQISWRRIAVPAASASL
ncbi:MAG: hypothetical protein HY286_08400 [Planctomycetes bacterium]|nr:hypothetical protein [Planctomycetota bacterium]